MRTLTRYLMREILMAWMAVIAILLLTSLGLFFGDTLADVARGKIPGYLLFSTIGLRSLEALSILVPLSLFLAVLLSYSRLYRDSEMAVLSACGVSRYDLCRPLVWLLVPGFIVLVVLSNWVSPWALRTNKAMVNEAARTISVVGLQPGRFQQIAANDGVVYVETLSEDGKSFTNAFIHTERDGRKDVITAKSGYQYTVEAQNGAPQSRYLALFDGFRSEGVPGQADYRWMHFKRNDVRLPDADEDDSPITKLGARTLTELRTRNGLPERAELQWRWAPPIAVVVLALLAVPLSRTTPRQGFYGNLVVAVMAYFIYANMLAVGRSWLEKGEIPEWLGLWWVHLAVVLITVLLMRNRVRRRRRRMAGATT